MKRVFITGVTGFVGSHLVDYLLDGDTPLGKVEIVGLKRWRSPLDNLVHLDLDELERSQRLVLLDGDLTDGVAMCDVIEVAQPDYVFHLAAQSFVPYSYTAPGATLDANVRGTMNLLEACAEYAPRARVHVCGSSEVYGQVPPGRTPIREDEPFRPVSPYAVSKCATENFAFMYARAFDLHTVVSRAFTHSGPRRGLPFFDSNFCWQAARIEKGLQDRFMVGNLDASRTVVDVRDLVRAYVLLVKHGAAGEAYNLGGCETYIVREVLARVRELAGIPARVKTEIDPERIRPADVTTQLPDLAKFTALETGWKPTIPYRDTLTSMIDYWRERV